MFTIKETLVG